VGEASLSRRSTAFECVCGLALSLQQALEGNKHWTLRFRLVLLCCAVAAVLQWWLGRPTAHATGLVPCLAAAVLSRATREKWSLWCRCGAVCCGAAQQLAL
jgi:hypothetical protein